MFVFDINKMEVKMKILAHSYLKLPIYNKRTKENRTNNFVNNPIQINFNGKKEKIDFQEELNKELDKRSLFQKLFGLGKNRAYSKVLERCQAQSLIDIEEEKVVILKDEILHSLPISCCPHIDPLLPLEVQQFIFEKIILRDNILKQFCGNILFEKNGLTATIPNTIMLVGSDDKVLEETVKDTALHSECDFIHLKDDDSKALQNSIYESLTKTKENFSKKGRRSLIWIEGFDELLNPQHCSLKNIQQWISIVNRSASDFGSTIIFSTKNENNSIPEAIKTNSLTMKFNLPTKPPEYEISIKKMQLREKNEVAKMKILEEAMQKLAKKLN